MIATRPGLGLISQDKMQNCWIILFRIEFKLQGFCEDKL